MSLRLAEVINIDYGKGTCTLLFRDGGVGFKKQGVKLNSLYAGRGWGIHMGVEEHSLVVVGESVNGEMRILSYINSPAFYNENLDETLLASLNYDEFPYRISRAGEIIFQSKSNSVIALNEVGDIVLETVDGNLIEIDKESDAIVQKSAQRYITSEAGISTIGVIKRDRRTEEERKEDNDLTLGFASIFGSDYDLNLDIVGENPGYEDEFGNNFDPVKNKALTEWNFKIVEKADSNVVLDELQQQGQTVDSGAIGGQSSLDESITTERDDRGMYPNDLAYIMVGTLVGDFGEYEIIKAGKILRFSEFDYTKIANLQPLEEIVDSVDIISLATMCRIKFKSGWELSIDKEGQTKLAIPAASSINEKHQGRSLICKSDGSWDIYVGKQISEDSSLESNQSITTNTDVATSRKDRSLTATLEGNLETKIGKDDEKQQSVIMELAGGAVAKIGKDSKKNSIVIDCDGGIDIEVNANNNDGKAVHLQVKGKVRLQATQKVIIDSDVGIEIGEDATQPLVLGYKMLALFNSHIHPTPAGPSLPTTNLMTNAQLSPKNKVK